MSDRKMSGAGLARAVGKTPWLRGLPRDVGVLAAIAFCVALGFGIVAPSIPIFAKTFGVSAFLAGAVVSVFALMRLITAPGAGWMVNRIGERAVLASGLAIVALSSFVAGFSHSYDQLIVLRGLGGIGSAMFTVSALALLLRTAGPDQRGRASGAFQAGFLFGGVTGPALGGIVVGWSIRAPFFVYAGTLTVATIVALVFLRSPEKDATEQSEVTSQEVSPTSEQPAPIKLSHALQIRAYWAALVANLTNGFTAFGLRTSLVPIFVVESLHRGPGLSGLGFLVSAIFQAAALLPGGRLADQRGRRPAMIIGTITVVIGMTLLVVDYNVIVFLMAMAVLGVGTAFLGSAPSAIVGDIAGGRKGGSVVATFSMVSDFGAILGPLVAGLLADQLGFHWAFVSGVLVAVVAVGFAFAMQETRKAPRAPDSEAAPATE